MNTVLVTGTNRGLGLEFCRQYARAGWRVIACCRGPEQASALKRLASDNANVQIYRLDVCDHATIDCLAEQLADTAIDQLIANAAYYGDCRGHGYGRLDYQAWRTTLETNVLGAVKVAEAFTPHLRRRAKPLIVAVSSLMGSIADNNSGGSLLYRSSKAALNAAMKSLAIDLRSAGIGVLIFHPGWVKTDMGGPDALIDAETSVAGMMKQIDVFDISQSGSFLNYDGAALPW
ncbi:SDR family oxidoreductase [Methylomarinum sp. Ch1-1]|uniref:SDR family oxidoreductase n=1 Tax=Methylomarinum roseum TaxID=3067653 RepID=A0AAU7NRK0_9GAMM|nr:SDR family oxidoreductase [Methylomarinum sp. Ch1-1]MDP4520438.1 SDR family oxidoreductase [Methylomarinum sp. Ch1-1]